MISSILWFLGVGISVMAIAVITMPKWQFKLMTKLKMKPIQRSDTFIQRLGLLKLAIGIALMALAVVLA